MITLNGAPVLSGKISMPYQGRWTARLQTSSGAKLTGVARIADQTGAVFQGGFRRAGAVASRGYSRIVAAPGLHTVQDPQHFQKSTIGQAFQAILTAAGEKADPFIFPTTTATPLAFWSTVLGTGGANLQILAEKNELIWRTRPGGSVWLGPDAESLRSPAPVTVIDADPSGDCYLVAPSGLWLQPGMVQSFGKVVRVEYMIGEHLRAKVWVNAD